MRNALSIMLSYITILCHAQVFDITQFGAVGDSNTINTNAIQRAIDTCYFMGGGTVYVPAGNFRTGTLILKSNVTFHISKNGTISGSEDFAHYPDLPPQKRTYTDYYTSRALFFAEGEGNITLTGEGTIDGNGENPQYEILDFLRPFGIRIISCRNVKIEGLHLRQSAFWMMHLFDDDSVVVKNIRITNHATGNNDGIDIDGCRNVLIDSCIIDSNDDPIVMKTTSPVGSQNIEIKNCTVGTYARTLKIGTETNGPIKNVHIHDCKIQYSTLGPDGGNHAAGCGILLAIVDGGSMENILVEDIDMSGVSTAIMLRLGNRARNYTVGAPAPGVGWARNIELRNITAVTTSNRSSAISGIPGHNINYIKLSNIDITYPGGLPHYAVNSAVPENEAGKPDPGIFGDTLPASGLYIRHADSVVLQNVCFYAQQPDERDEIFLIGAYLMDTANVCGSYATAYTGVANNEAEAKIALYPNPVSNTLIVESVKPGTAIVVTDMMGKTVISTIAAGERITLDVSQLPAGMYYAGRQKFIKE